MQAGTLADRLNISQCFGRVVTQRWTGKDAEKDCPAQYSFCVRGAAWQGGSTEVLRGTIIFSDGEGEKG